MYKLAICIYIDIFVLHIKLCLQNQSSIPGNKTFTILVNGIADPPSEATHLTCIYLQMG